MFEVAHSGEDHRDPMLVGRLDHLFISDRAARLDDSRDPVAGGFIKSITPFEAYDGASLVGADVIPRDDAQFYGVTPGVQVVFKVRFLNDFVSPLRSSQIFRATIFVVGNGIAELDAREVVIVVPAGSTALI